MAPSESEDYRIEHLIDHLHFDRQTAEFAVLRPALLRAAVRRVAAMSTVNGADLINIPEGDRQLLRKALDLAVTSHPMDFSAGQRDRLARIYDDLARDGLLAPAVEG